MAWPWEVVERDHEIQDPVSPEKIRLLGDGKGGPALILAATYRCRVRGVEIRPAFAEAARARAVMNLTTQAAQVACFHNVAAHLEPGGCFVVEVGVPGLQRLPPGETIHAFHVSETRWGLDEYDVARQGLTSHHFEIVDGRLVRFSVPFRYAWPAELDLTGTACRDEAE